MFPTFLRLPPLSLISYSNVLSPPFAVSTSLITHTHPHTYSPASHFHPTKSVVSPSMLSPPAIVSNILRMWWRRRRGGWDERIWKMYKKKLGKPFETGREREREIETGREMRRGISINNFCTTFSKIPFRRHFPETCQATKQHTHV